MSPEEFRKYGHEVVDWMADYLAGIREYPVLPGVAPGELTDSLPASAPETGEPMDAILADFRRQIVPALTHWNHPGFMAYFSVSASGPGILGEMLTAALNVNGMLWKSCPAATELEQVTLSWLRQWLRLPEEFFGIIHDTASTSTLHAIAAARQWAEPGTRAEGGSQYLTLYTSEHAHSSVEKGAMAIGIGQRNVRKIAVDEGFRMKPDALAAAIERDQTAGLKPFCVVGTCGTTSIASIDPLPEIGEIARRHGLWFHVDGAYGGSAAVVPELNHLIDGAALADSMVVNPHKWLFTPIDISVLYTRRPDVMRSAFSLSPEYLRTKEDPRALNYMDYGVPLGRRFRALKLWFVLRYFGHEGISAIIRNHVKWAKDAATALEADGRFEIAAPVLLSLVCFRFKGTDEQNKELMERVNASGRAFLSHTVLDGAMTIRMALGNVNLRWNDVQLALNEIFRAAGTL